MARSGTWTTPGVAQYPIPSNPFSDPSIASIYNAIPIWVGAIVVSLLIFYPEKLSIIKHFALARGFELTLAIVGSMLAMSDVVGAKRQAHLDATARSVADRLRRVLTDIPRRANVYIDKYILNQAAFLTDVAASWAIGSGTSVLLFGNPFDKERGLYRLLLWLMIGHAGYRFLVKDIRDPNDPITTRQEVVLGRGFLLLSTLPHQIFRSTLHLATYVLWAPLDLVVILARRWTLEGYLKIVGGIMVIVSIVLGALR
ncbi:MAG: hypothetical protein AMXMBFR57_21510 [Acidimicrobiia bacterium]|jgi:hypothetical protein